VWVCIALDTSGVQQVHSDQHVEAESDVAGQTNETELAHDDSATPTTAHIEQLEVQEVAGNHLIKYHSLLQMSRQII